MARLLATALAALLALAPASIARADDLVRVLELVAFTDDRATGQVALFSSDVAPNTSAASDRYRLEIDGRAVAAPAAFLARLDLGRIAYADDTRSGGIRSRERRASCAMAGPATGDILRVRYLDYNGDQIVASEMKTVLSDAGNCLFSLEIRPRDDDALLAATRALVALQTVRALRR